MRQYYTDYVYAPVRSIAEASTTGHGTNIITGVAVGMKSTVIPCITVSVAVIAAYHLGRTSGVGDGHSAGIFGTAVATVSFVCIPCCWLNRLERESRRSNPSPGGQGSFVSKLELSSPCVRTQQRSREKYKSSRVSWPRNPC